MIQNTTSLIDNIISALKNVWSKLTGFESPKSSPKDAIPDVDDQEAGAAIVTDQEGDQQFIASQDEDGKEVVKPEKPDAEKEKPTPEELSDSHAGPPYTIEQVDNPEITHGFDTQPLEVKFPEEEREFFRGAPGQDIVISIIGAYPEILEIAGEGGNRYKCVYNSD